MLYLDGIGISFLIKEIKEKILRYKLTKIFQYDRVSFSLFFGKNNLIFQVKDNSTIFYLKDEKDPNTDFQSKFLLSLKKHLQNSILWVFLSLNPILLTSNFDKYSSGRFW